MTLKKIKTRRKVTEGKNAMNGMDCLCTVCVIGRDAAMMSVFALDDKRFENAITVVTTAFTFNHVTAELIYVKPSTEFAKPISLPQSNGYF